MRMTFTPRPNWHKEQKDLATRIAQIIGHSDRCPPFRKREGQEAESKTDWVLNTSNDWWLYFNPDGTCDLQYRYNWSEEQWAALKTVIEMFVSKAKE